MVSENEKWVLWKSYCGNTFWSVGPLKSEETIEIKRGLFKSDSLNKKGQFEVQQPNKLLALADCIYNIESMVLIARSLKDFIQQEINSQTTFIEVDILRNTEVLSSEYFIVNPLHVIDCIDKENSTIVFNRIDPSLVSSCKKLVLQEGVIPEDISIFRPKHLETCVFLRQSLSEKIKASGFTGISFISASSFRGF